MTFDAYHGWSVSCTSRLDDASGSIPTFKSHIILDSSGKKPGFRDIVGIHNISRIFLDKTSNCSWIILDCLTVPQPLRRMMRTDLIVMVLDSWTRRFCKNPSNDAMILVHNLRKTVLQTVYASPAMFKLLHMSAVLNSSEPNEITVKSHLSVPTALL